MTDRIRSRNRGSTLHNALRHLKTVIAAWATGVFWHLPGARWARGWLNAWELAGHLAEQQQIDMQALRQDDARLRAELAAVERGVAAPSPSQLDVTRVRRTPTVEAHAGDTEGAVPPVEGIEMPSSAEVRLRHATPAARSAEAGRVVDPPLGGRQPEPASAHDRTAPMGASLRCAEWAHSPIAPLVGSVPREQLEADLLVTQDELAGQASHLMKDLGGSAGVPGGAQ